MNTDFNQKGRQVAFIAYKDEPPYYTILAQDVSDFAKDIESKISACNQDTAKSSIAGAALGCFERFCGCILQISRMAQHEEHIRSTQHAVGEMVAYRGMEALIDFESLLFHGRSSLDRVAFFVAKQIYRQDCDDYTKLVNVLDDSKAKDPNDPNASSLINIITAANPIFEGIMYDIPHGKKSLRSHLIHKSTASENASARFTVHCIAPQKQIAFDSILGGYPIFNTSQSLGKGLAFVILNALSLYLGIGKTLSFEKFGLKWESKMVDYREYLSDNKNAISFTILNTTPSGCTLSPVSLRPEILNKAY